MRRAVAAFAVAVGLGAVPAQAAPFGPATASIAFVFSPPVTVNVSGDTAVFGGNDFIFSTTGSLAGNTTGRGTSNGALNFSPTVGVTVADAIPDFLVFQDRGGGTFNFSTTTVETQSFNLESGLSTSIALYVLGTMGDNNLGMTSGPTSITFTLNSTGGSSFSASATLSSPPDPIPEPGSLAVLIIGLLGLVRIRKGRE